MKKIYFLSLFVCGLCSCQKEPSQKVMGSPIDVYVAGWQGDRAIYWKNNSQIILGDSSKQSGANAIFLVSK